MAITATSDVRNALKISYRQCQKVTTRRVWPLGSPEGRPITRLPIQPLIRMAKDRCYTSQSAWTLNLALVPVPLLLN